MVNEPTKNSLYVLIASSLLCYISTYWCPVQLLQRLTHNSQTFLFSFYRVTRLYHQRLPRKLCRGTTHTQMSRVFAMLLCSMTFQTLCYVTCFFTKLVGLLIKPHQYFVLSSSRIFKEVCVKCQRSMTNRLSHGAAPV